MAATRLMRELIHGVTSSDAATRERSADEVTDVHKSLTADQVAVLAMVLIEARLSEDHRDAAEAQLHALAELAEWHDLPAEALERLRVVDPGDDPSQREYLMDLLDEGT